MKNWEDLANAVVHRAAEDWKLAVKRIKNSRKPSKADMIGNILKMRVNESK